MGERGIIDAPVAAEKSTPIRMPEIGHSIWLGSLSGGIDSDGTIGWPQSALLRFSGPGCWRNLKQIGEVGAEQAGKPTASHGLRSHIVNLW